jgi:E3 ubiquitin-protein ligase CHFR
MSFLELDITSESLLALGAPSTKRCDFCGDSFCGITVPSRCSTAPVSVQHPEALSDVEDLMLSTQVYACFNGNYIEVEIMLEYLSAKSIAPASIYQQVCSFRCQELLPLMSLQIVEYLRTRTDGYRALLETGLFQPDDDHLADHTTLQNNRCCRSCSSKIFFWGLMDWWIRERKKGQIDASKRKDCVDGRDCVSQGDIGVFSPCEVSAYSD